MTAQKPTPDPPEAPQSQRPRPIPPAAAGPTLDRALDLVRFLRAHCPWDASQTPESLLPYLLEEAHEVADAVTQHDDAALASELGDLLLNVAFQAVLAEERAAFTAEDVVRGLEEKMQRRHPQLYGGGPAEPWEQLKARERAEAAPSSVLSGLASGLDPLSRAQRIQERVSTVGFDWANAHGAFAKVAEELEEVRLALEAEPSPALEEELGDLMFAVVNLTRLAGSHAMRALQSANLKFSRRFEALESLARVRGLRLEELSLEELDGLWDEVKLVERS
jgi:MazG family protein